ncbi:MAG: arginyltransferase [Proteobacteria bacterium]|nr:arginyltransferase [Pseudomonadota bacterium]
MTFQRPSPHLLTFYRSGPMPCPYLENNTEQQLFTELSGPGTQEQFETLSRSGFRRSHQVIYRPACRACNACIPVRVAARDFIMSRAWRRVIKNNPDLTLENTGKNATDEQYDLFQRYVAERHADGEMANMSRRDYSAMVLSSPIDTSIFEFRSKDGILIAGCLVDHLSDGLSAVYSFFAPALERRSLGSYIVIRLIQFARLHNLDHVYLGYWVKGSPKMAYKARFQPLEAFDANGWTVIDPQ